MIPVESSTESWILSYLVNSLWQVPLLFAAGLLAARLLRRAGPAPEHRLWVIVLFLQAVLPACTAAQLAWLPDLLAWLSPAHSARAGSVTIIMGEGSASAAIHFPHALLAAIALAYLAIFAWFAARFIWRCLRLRSMRSASTGFPLAGEAACSWSRCSERLGVRNASIATSPHVFAPVTIGISRKLLLLPAGIASRISDAEMHSVIAHEFAHMRRHDFLKNLLYELLALPVSYHPALWLTRERVTESREIICDRMAADFTGRTTYSRALLRLASLMIESAPAGAAHALGIFDSQTLERRLMKLAENHSEIRGLPRFAALAACLALGAATCASALVLHLNVSNAGADEHHATRHPAVVHVSPKVMEGQVIHKVPPKYPVEAKKAGIQGKVVLNVVIGKDGSVKSLKVESGPKELRQSSLDAVRQWKYKPFLLNGRPVQVATTVNIIYSLQ